MHRPPRRLQACFQGTGAKLGAVARSPAALTTPKRPAGRVSTPFLEIGRVALGPLAPAGWRNQRVCAPPGRLASGTPAAAWIARGSRRPPPFRGPFEHGWAGASTLGVNKPRIPCDLLRVPLWRKKGGSRTTGDVLTRAMSRRRNRFRQLHLAGRVRRSLLLLSCSRTSCHRDHRPWSSRSSSDPTTCAKSAATRRGGALSEYVARWPAEQLDERWRRSDRR